MNSNPLVNPDSGAPASGAIVYIREADRDTLPEHLRKMPGKMYAVHDPDGTCLAISPDRALAFELARENDLTPVSVH